MTTIPQDKMDENVTENLNTQVNIATEKYVVPVNGDITATENDAVETINNDSTDVGNNEVTTKLCEGENSDPKNIQKGHTDEESNAITAVDKAIIGTENEVDKTTNDDTIEAADNCDMNHRPTEGNQTGTTDEGDGLMKKFGKLATGIKAKLTKKDKKEPYVKDPTTRTYSEQCKEGEEIENERTANRSGLIPEHVHSDNYNFTNPQRGKLLLVINQNFFRQATRHGAEQDLRNMKTVADKLGVKLLNKSQESHIDLSQRDTLKWLQKAQKMDHSKCDCFMFMISTHGLQQPNPNIGGKIDHALVCADDELIFTRTIIEMFSDDYCPSLRGKPKIFIIQACRGEELDHGSKVNVNISQKNTTLQQQTKPAKSDRKRAEETDAKAGQDSWASSTDTAYIECHPDMLVMYAVPPGKFAWRNQSDGSWMIHYLHKVLVSPDPPRNFQRVLTRVSAMVSQRATDVPDNPTFHGKKAVPVVEHKLTKDIMFY